jgi:hypothetical protein
MRFSYRAGFEYQVLPLAEYANDFEPMMKPITEAHSSNRKNS